MSEIPTALNGYPVRAWLPANGRRETWLAVCDRSAEPECATEPFTVWTVFPHPDAPDRWRCTDGVYDLPGLDEAMREALRIGKWL